MLSHEGEVRCGVDEYIGKIAPESARSDRALDNFIDRPRIEFARRRPGVYLVPMRDSHFQAQAVRPLRDAPIGLDEKCGTRFGGRACEHVFTNGRIGEIFAIDSFKTGKSRKIPGGLLHAGAGLIEDQIRVQGEAKLCKKKRDCPVPGHKADYTPHLVNPMLLPISSHARLILFEVAQPSERRKRLQPGRVRDAFVITCFTRVRAGGALRQTRWNPQRCS